MRCRVVPCPAVRCGVVRCCAALRALLHLHLVRTCQVSFEMSYLYKYQISVLLHQVCTYYVVESQKKHSQLSSAQLYNPEAERRALPCGAGLCCAALRCPFLSSIRVPCDVCRCVCLIQGSPWGFCFYLKSRGGCGKLNREITQGVRSSYQVPRSLRARERMP